MQIWRFAEPAKALAALTHVLENLGPGDTLSSGVLKAKVVVKKNAEKRGSTAFHAVSVAWDLEKMAETAAGGMELPEEAQKKMVQTFKKLYGEKGTFWIGADDKHLLTVAAADWAAARTMLDNHHKGTDTVGKKKGYQEARQELPAAATMYGLVDVVSSGAFIVDMVKPRLAGFGIPIPDKYPAELPRGNPSFFAYAVTLDEKRLSTDWVVSASMVQDIFKAFVLPFRGGF